MSSRAKYDLVGLDTMLLKGSTTEDIIKALSIPQGSISDRRSRLRESGLLTDDAHMSFREIGNALGIHHVTAKRAYDSAIRKMEEYCRFKKMIDFYDLVV